MEIALKEERQKFLTMLSQFRHDWLNHFQVLLGYLKLERYDLCEEYIRRVTNETKNESRVAALGIPSLVIFLLTHNVLHQELKVEVEVPELITLSHLSEAKQRRVSQLIEGVIETYRLHSVSDRGQPNTLFLLIQRLEETLYLSIEFEGRLDDKACLQALRALARQRENEAERFVEGLHNERESVMEFYVPLTRKKEVKR